MMSVMECLQSTIFLWSSTWCSTIEELAELAAFLAQPEVWYTPQVLLSIWNQDEYSLNNHMGKPSQKKAFIPLIIVSKLYSIHFVTGWKLRSHVSSRLQKTTPLENRGPVISVHNSSFDLSLYMFALVFKTSTYLNNTGLSCSAAIALLSMFEISGRSPVKLLHSSGISNEGLNRKVIFTISLN